MSRIVVGDIRHAGYRGGFYRPGDTVAAHLGNTMFVTDVCEVDAAFHDVDYQHSLRSLLKRVGNFTLRIHDIEHFYKGVRLATLYPVETDKARMETLLSNSVFSEHVTMSVKLQKPPIMTMTSSTALEVGDMLSLSYLTLLEPKGDGFYTVLHDYALNLQEGPRHECYD